MIVGFRFELFVLALAGCATGPQGLLETPLGTGPTVTVDWDAEPLPDLPFPNDLATRVDQSSPTGLRLNISEVAATEAESHARQKLNEMTGFGIYSPVTVAFEAPLDLGNILRRHQDDFYLPTAFDDDAVFLVNIDPESADFLQPVAVDVGHGRFPMDIPDYDRYFPNDSRWESPSLLFETVDEDLNGNGVLDWGEDTDNDGVLDRPNVYPEGGDPRADLLTWYERETNTLILRPIEPLDEETTYAVVLTNRLVGEDGEPVRSPWEYINHTRQTEVLIPVVDAMPKWNLCLDDIAFAWSFTTGRITGDLVDIYRGLHNEGPWSSMGDEYPAGVTEALQVHNIVDQDNQYRLPMTSIMDPLVLLGFFEGEGGDALTESYHSFADSIVSGVFETPYLLADRDDGGYDDTDEWWQLDPVAGTYSAEPQRVPFTCVLPKEGYGFEPPYDVAIFGHGYGSSRFDLLGFAHAFTRQGFAACSIDFPGHGPTIGAEKKILIEAALAAYGLLPFYYSLVDSRMRDLNNDGSGDSGGDQWTADPFHTRDMVRQAVVDWMQMIRSLQACGSSSMQFVESTTEGPNPTGETAISCDWDGDGIADMGGPNARFVLAGGSLGGINAGVAAAVIPDVEAFSPIVAGGGTLDIGVRTKIGGAVEALIGRLTTPLFLGYPTEAGGLEVVQMVNSVTDMVEMKVGTIDSIPAGGKVVVQNLTKGTIREGMIPEDGAFRLSIAADALDYFEKREVSGMPLDGPEVGETYTVEDSTLIGDQLQVTLYDATGALVQTLSTFEEDVEIEGVTIAAGAPLVAGNHGSGHIRGTPQVRKLAMVLASALEPGDAISYAPHWFEEPFEALGGNPTNVLAVPTPGDMIVCINTGIALSRAAGLVDYTTIDDRYGMTIDRFLIETEVIRGLAAYGPWASKVTGESVLFDADDLDDGQDGTGAPSDIPLRITVDTPAGQSGMRLPYASTTGSHGFGLPEPSADFDINNYALNQIAWFLGTFGQELIEDPCFEDGSCDFFRPFDEEAGQ